MDLSNLLSQYITERDNYRASYGARQDDLITVSKGGPLGLAKVINGHAERLAIELPDLTLAQWEALSELTGSHLAEMRLRLEAFRR